MFITSSEEKQSHFFNDDIFKRDHIMLLQSVAKDFTIFEKVLINEIKIKDDKTLI